MLQAGKSSVTRWLDYLFNILPFTTMKISLKEKCDVLKKQWSNMAKQSNVCL